MISLALVIPLAMMSLITFITLSIFTWNSAATSRILSHTLWERASSHLKLVASCTILSRTNLMISLALVIPFATASRTILSTSSTFTFNFLAASFKVLQILSERISSQVIKFSIMSSLLGKKCFLISSMISLALVIPLAMISFMTCITLSILIFIAAATSLILAHQSALITSSHFKFLASSTILSRTNLMISLALVIPFLTASRMILSTSSTFTFNFLVASFKDVQIFSERISSQVISFSIMSSFPGKKCFLISSMISLTLVIPLAMISFMTFITLSILIFIAAATSSILAHTVAGRASSHLKLVASSTILSRTN